MFDRSEILARVDLADLAEELLGPAKGGGRHRAWRCPSATHAQTGATPPLNIFRARSGDERWHCFGCGLGGTAIDLVMATRGGEVRDAFEFLAGRVGVREPLRGDRVAGPARPTPAPASALPAPALAAYVERTARMLWDRPGGEVRRYLCRARGLPQDVLRANRVGADPGPWVLARPAGLPRSGPGAVLPILDDGRVVFAQVRLLRPRPTGPKYLNPTAEVAHNPRVGVFVPAEGIGRECWVVTEGPLDALSAAAAGFPSAAVLGAGVPDERVAARLAELPGRLVIAFDADRPGRAGADRLAHLLDEAGRRPVVLTPPASVGDLNGWAVAARERWAAVLRRAVEGRLHPDLPHWEREVARGPAVGR